MYIECLAQCLPYIKSPVNASYRYWLEKGGKSPIKISSSSTSVCGGGYFYIQLYLLIPLDNIHIQDIYLLFAGYFESIKGQLNILLCTKKKKKKENKRKKIHTRKP